MRKQIAFTGAALTVILLAMTPAGAVSLTVGGGGGLLSVDGSSESSSSGGVGVDVDLGGGPDGGISVDADLDADLDTDGDATLDLFGGNKKLVTTGGDNLVTVDTGDDSAALITLFGGSGAGGTGLDVDLGGGTGDGVAVSLFGGSEADAEVAVDPFGSEEAAFISLFGTGGGEGSGGATTGLLDDDPLGDGLDLFDSGQAGNVDNTSTGSIPGAGSGGTGGSGVGGSGGTGGSGVGGSGGFMAPMPATLSPGGRARIAANADVQARGACFSPDDQQIANLRGRAIYDGSVTASWRSAVDVSIVPINLCPDARARLAAALDADDNIGYMQAAVAADARLSASLDPSYDPEDVLAVDQAGQKLTVYVY